MSYTINKIQSEMQAAGSHWWDKDTMRWFKCRVGEQVYEGTGGIYFVTSEKGPSEKRLFSVRKYDPATKEVDTVGEFNSLTRSVAHRIAAEQAGPAATVTKEAHRELSEAEQLALDIQRGGGCASATSAAWLIRLATQHHKIQENRCNIGDDRYFDENGEEIGELAKVRDALRTAAKKHNCEGVILSGDPRGCTVKLILPNGATNDWGKEGWCVPTRD